MSSLPDYIDYDWDYAPEDPFETISPITGQTYYLHTKTVKLNNKNQTIYYFSETQLWQECCELPIGYEVVFAARSGRPVLKLL